ncbi:MAG: hypothetical protein II993_01185 [Anaerotignum sp.]|nr:hypothetical protein [Anaerotignum sp.]MBQ3614599.1 hypothetical protein [Anaerotignum sp.]
MEVKVLLQHGSNVYEPVLEGGVEWYASIMGKAGRLKCKVVRDGIVNFVEGDKVTLSVDGRICFSGYVMTKERTSEQIISVTAYDQMFYLARNKATYVFVNKGMQEIIQTIGADYGLRIGHITDSGWKIPQRIEEGETLMDIMLSALEICGYATGKEYFLFDQGGALVVKEREEMVTDAVLKCDGGISDYTYKTDISKDTYNGVQLYHAGRKETERKAYQVESAEKVKEWGRLQYYKKVAYTLNQAQLKEMAEGILKQKNRVIKKLLIENINGDILLFAGNSIWLEIPDLAEISLRGKALIESCTHIFEDGEHRAQMEIRIEEA